MEGLLLFLFFGSAPLANAQDSTRAFTMEDFFAQVIAHHPVVKQANLLSEKARQEIRMARGVLDPSVNAKIYHKELNGENYYTLWDNALRVPVWYGVDLKAGFERSSGINVNGENITPPQGLSYVGISVPLGQGLFIDERRSTIRQALLLSNLAEADKVKTINKLLLEAAKAYWDWAYAYQKWQLYRQGYELALFRLEAIKERVVQGDMAAIDSVEARVETLNRQVMASQAQVEYQNTTLDVSNYLWREQNTPLEITPYVVPSLAGTETTPIGADSLRVLVNAARTNHPDLVKIGTKLRQLDIERQFVADKFKPKLNLEYNLLGKGFAFDGKINNGSYLSNNYKFGLSFSYPLFLRNERGKFQLTKLKILESELDLQQTNREIVNRINVAYNDWIALEMQIRMQEQMVVNTQRLRDGEQQKFENGESSVFLINTREMSMITNLVKLFELRTKYAKNKAMLQWSAGQFSPVR